MKSTDYILQHIPTCSHLFAIETKRKYKHTPSQMQIEARLCFHISVKWETGGSAFDSPAPSWPGARPKSKDLFRTLWEAYNVPLLLGPGACKCFLLFNLWAFQSL